MKNIFISLLILLAILSSCNRKKEIIEDQTVGFQLEASEIPGVQRMQPYRSEITTNYLNKDYTITITRESNESLPKIKSSTDITYLDNQIIVLIKEKSGKEFFKQTFTKQNFSSVVNQSFLANSILEGIVFDKTTPNGFLFAASVSYPQTDLYIPISLTVSKDGKLSMKKEELMEEIYEEE